MIPKDQWPTYPCKEFDGQGWEAKILSVSKDKRSVFCRCIHEKDPKTGRSYGQAVRTTYLRPVPSSAALLSAQKENAVSLTTPMMAAHIMEEDRALCIVIDSGLEPSECLQDVHAPLSTSASSLIIPDSLEVEADMIAGEFANGSSLVSLAMRTVLKKVKIDGQIVSRVELVSYEQIGETT